MEWPLAHAAAISERPSEGTQRLSKGGESGGGGGSCQRVSRVQVAPLAPLKEAQWLT